MIVAIAVVLCGLLFTLLRPREYVTGGNGVRPLNMIAVVDADERVCIDNVDVPTGTAGLDLVVGPVAGQGAVSVTLRDGRHVVRRGSAELARFERTRVMLGSPVNEDGLFRLCLRPTGAAMNLAGRNGLFAGDPPVADDALVAVPSLWFAPPDGARRSFASQWATALERATVFAPGWVTSGVLAVVLTLLVPLVLVGGVALVARPIRLAPVIIVLVSVASSASWAVMTVPFDGHDEPDHFAYVQSLVERGVRPDAVPGKRLTFSSAQVQTLDAVRHYSRIGAQEQVPLWNPSAGRALDRRLAADPPRDDGGGYADATRWHAPLYYAVASVGYRLAGGDIRSELMGARLITALLASIIALCAFGIVREIAPRQLQLAVLAGVITALQPGLSFVSGIVNNDTGANAAAAVMAYLTVRLLCRGVERRTLLALAATMAVSPFLKGTAMALYPPVLAAVGLVAWRARRDRSTLLSLAAGALAFAAVWVATSVALRGYTAGVDMRGAGASVDSPFDSLSGRLSYAWQTVLPRLPYLQDHFTQAWPFFEIYIFGTWGVFGWYTVLGPRWLSVAATVVAALLIVCGLTAAWQRRTRVAIWGPPIAFLVLVPIAVLVAVAFAYYTPGGWNVLAEQGRYLFTAAAPIGALAGLAVVGLPVRWRSPAAVTLAVLVAGAAAFTRLNYVGVTFAGM